MGSVYPTWDKICEMLGTVNDANAEFGTLGFVTTALMAAGLKAKVKATNTGDFVWMGRVDDGDIGGYKAIGSSQISKTLGSGGDEHGFVFGNWNDLLIPTWGAVELTVDEVTLADQALVRIISYQLADVIIRHGESFCKGTAAKRA
jgi:hypothetical protein